MNTKTPQQQAEELADSAAVKCLEYLDIDPNYELGQDRANIANTILTAVNLPDLIQAKKEHDQLRLEKLVANECSVWAGKENMNPAEAIRSLESERDQLKQHVKSLELRITDLKGKLSMIEDTNFRWSGEIEQLQSANAELVKFKERLEWLHSNAGELDSEGYEWGVARVKFDASGRFVTFQWTNSDHSDLDSAMKGSK